MVQVSFFISTAVNEINLSQVSRMQRMPSFHRFFLRRESVFLSTRVSDTRVQ